MELRKITDEKVKAAAQGLAITPNQEKILGMILEEPEETRGEFCEALADFCQLLNEHHAEPGETYEEYLERQGETARPVIEALREALAHGITVKKAKEEESA